MRDGKGGQVVVSIRGFFIETTKKGCKGCKPRGWVGSKNLRTGFNFCFETVIVMKSRGSMSMTQQGW